MKKYPKLLKIYSKINLLIVFFICRDREGMVNKKDFDALAPHVDGVSLMTYDYTSGIT